MTYWATLWYAGAVVFSIGYEGQTLQECVELSKVMMTDINESYLDEEKSLELEALMFPTNKFYTSCQTDFLESDEKYAE
jgi:hypothetical protein